MTILWQLFGTRLHFVQQHHGDDLVTVFGDVFLSDNIRYEYQDKYNFIINNFRKVCVKHFLKWFCKILFPNFWNTHTHTHTQAYRHTYTHTYIHTHTYTHTHTHTIKINAMLDVVLVDLSVACIKLSLHVIFLEGRTFKKRGKFCHYDGTDFEEGNEIITHDRCETCKCEDGKPVSNNSVKCGRNNPYSMIHQSGERSEKGCWCGLGLSWFDPSWIMVLGWGLPITS